MQLEKIEIIKEISFNDLCSRLKEVRLRGFPEVKIYENSNVSIKRVSPEDILKKVFTPQPTIYQDHLDRISSMQILFQEKGIDIYNLNGGYDYIATDSEGNESEWTIIPPVIEVMTINPINSGLDYSELLGDRLKELMQDGGHTLNPELNSLNFSEYPIIRTFIPQICDGSHRIHSAIVNNSPQNILLVENITEGFPYYAVPQPYSSVRIIPTRDETELKIHILTDPGHKLLYRSFPTGGIKSGNVRTAKKSDFI